VLQPESRRCLVRLEGSFAPVTIGGSFCVMPDSEVGSQSLPSASPFFLRSASPAALAHMAVSRRGCGGHRRKLVGILEKGGGPDRVLEKKQGL
jgi:hypothetical protein